MNIVAISGKLGSGKSTAANYLTNEYKYVQLSIAGSLKQYVRDKYHLNNLHTDTELGKATPLTQYPILTSPEVDEATTYLQDMVVSSQREGYWTPRSLLVLEGAVMRAINPDYWITKVSDIIEYSNHKYFVLPDLRFRSEIEYLRKRFGNQVITVRVLRPGTGGDTSHSEVDLDGYEFDYVIDNSLSLDNMYTQLDWMIEAMAAEME